MKALSRIARHGSEEFLYQNCNSAVERDGHGQDDEQTNSGISTLTMFVLGGAFGTPSLTVWAFWSDARIGTGQVTLCHNANPFLSAAVPRGYENEAQKGAHVRIRLSLSKTLLQQCSVL